MNRRLDVVLDVAMVTVSAIIGIVVLGRALDTRAARSVEGIPVVGNILTGTRAVVRQVYNP